MNEFIDSYGRLPSVEYLIMPFFDIDIKVNEVDSIAKEDSFIYVSSGSAHKNHTNLFLAWQYNYNRGIMNKLYITINESLDNKTAGMLQNMRSKGVPIVNLGVVSQDEVYAICKKVKYSIFPSFIETIGLNLVESSYLGCKVLAPDLEYVDEVLVPSLKFNPFDPEDIAQKVEFALKNNLPNPQVIMQNDINKFIDLLNT